MRNFITVPSASYAASTPILQRAPSSPATLKAVSAQWKIFPEYTEGLNDLEGYSHIYLLYHCHRAEPSPMMIAPFIQKTKRGLFSTRVPGRPNPIGMSIVQLLSREDNVLHIEAIDVLDGTPLLDIKPYSRRIDCVEGTRNGWQDEVDDPKPIKLGSRNRALTRNYFDDFSTLNEIFFH